jgi:hypothetical protein
MSITYSDEHPMKFFVRCASVLPPRVRIGRKKILLTNRTSIHHIILYIIIHYIVHGSRIIFHSA